MLKRLLPSLIHFARLQRLSPQGCLPLIPSMTTTPIRFYANKDKKSAADSKKKGSKSKINFDAENEDFSALLDVDTYKANLRHELDRLRDEFVQQYSLRTNLAAFEQLLVRLPEGSKPLSHIATVTLKNPQMVVIQVSKSDYMKNVQEALQRSAMNVNPSTNVQGLMIFLQIPKVTRERREQMAQKAKTSYETTKKRLTGVKEKVQKPWEKEAVGKVSSDLLFKARKYTDQLVRDYDAEAEKMMKAKQKELMEELSS